MSNDPNLDENGKRRERRMTNKIFLLVFGTTRPSLSDDQYQALNMIWSSTPKNKVDKMSKMIAVSGNEIERDAQPSSSNPYKFFFSLCIPGPVQQ